MRLRLFQIIFSLLLCNVAIAQSELLSLGPWNLTNVNGELKLGGLSGVTTSNSYGYYNSMKTTNIYGGLVLNTKSYIWNPEFMLLYVDGGYIPMSHQDQNQNFVFPNRYDVMNTEKFHVNVTLLPRKKFTLTTFANFDHSYNSRENLTDIQTDSKNYGAVFTLKTRYLPLNINYSTTQWKSREIQTGRVYSYDQKNLEAKMSKSFGTRDRNDILYTHHDFLRQDFNFATTKNISDNITLIDNVFLDSARRANLVSNINGIIQRGTDSFSQIRANENLLYKLPHNLGLNAAYGYYYMARANEYFQEHIVNGNLSHQLFSSLQTNLLFEFTGTNESVYKETTAKGGLAMNYHKRLPGDGLLTINYDYSRLHTAHQSSDAPLVVNNEEVTLSDNQITLLKKPYININTVVVKDIATTTIIYQLNIDYLVVEKNNYIEIQRIPGGQIPNNTTVFVSYTANQPGSYSYDGNFNNFSINLALYKRIFNLYYKTSKSDYVNLIKADNLVLNYLTDNVYGMRIEYRVVNFGVDYDDYRSSIVPYKLTRYFLNLQGNIAHKLIYSINSNWRIYKIKSDSTDRVYKDVSGMIGYSLSATTKLDLTASYQKQEGQQINLDLFSGRFKFTKTIRKITYSGGVEAYSRVYLSTQATNYYGGFIQLVKKI